jgi:hypothetical protein
LRRHIAGARPHPTDNLELYKINCILSIDCVYGLRGGIRFWRNEAKSKECVKSKILWAVYDNANKVRVS